MQRREQRRAGLHNQEAVAALQQQLAAAAADLAANAERESAQAIEARRLVALWEDRPAGEQPMLHLIIHKARLGLPAGQGA